MPTFKIVGVKEGFFGEAVVFTAMTPFLPRIGEEVEREKIYKVKRIIYDFSDPGWTNSINVKIVVE